MNRADFQSLANLRIKEAKVLLDNGYFAGAYYLAGYAVECALKACIAKQTTRYSYPPSPDTVRSMYVHDLTKLLKPAGLQAAHDTEILTNRLFEANWIIVKDWSEQSSYDNSFTQVLALDLYGAIVDRRNGVLTWLKKRW